MQPESTAPPACRPGRQRPVLRRIVSVGLAAGGLGLALAPGASAADLPNVSKNVTLVTNVPDPGMISGTFAHTGNFFYSSGAGDLRAYDTSDPRAPKLLGETTQAEFENESMTYGEKRVDGVLRRFVFVGNDIVQATGAGTSGPQPAIGHIGGREVVVFDVTDPTAPTEYKRIETLTSTHTLQCLDVACSYAYTAGSSGRFSILDLRSLGDDSVAGKDALKEVTVADPADSTKQIAAGESPSAKGEFPSGHYWDFDSAGIAWHTGGGGASAFNITNPRAPRLLNTTNAEGASMIDANETKNYNDFILHNSMRPNADRFVPGPDAAPSVQKGNVLVVTEEDYANTAVGTSTGQELVCADSGSIETWQVPSLTGLAASSAAGSGTIAPLDKLNPVQSLPSTTGFCSAHWFDYHQDGFLAQGFYNGGLQIIDVRDAKNLASFGFFRTPAATQVWDAYWVPVRDAAGVDTGRKTNTVYTADLVKGLDVFDVALPGAAEQTPPVVPEVPVAVLLPLLGAGLVGAAVVMRRRRAQPA